MRVSVLRSLLREKRCVFVGIVVGRHSGRKLKEKGEKGEL